MTSPVYVAQVDALRALADLRTALGRIHLDHPTRMHATAADPIADLLECMEHNFRLLGTYLNGYVYKA